MSTDYIINAAPMVIEYGTQDLSTVQLPIQPENIPQHLPKFYLYTQKGPTNPQLVSGVSRTNIFGIDSFDVRKKYANYATVMANNIDAQANSCMIQRIKPTDAGPNANIVLYLDVLETTVDLTQRNSDGSIALDTNGTPITTGTAPGYKVKFVYAYDSANNNTFGQKTVVPGDQVDTTVTPNVTSTRYPILEIAASSFGEWGNNVGIRLWAPNSVTSPDIPMQLIQKTRVYPYYISVINRNDVYSSATVKPTIFGDNLVKFTFEPGVVNPANDAQMYIGDVFLSSYSNLNNPGYPPTIGDFGSVYVYNSNLDTILQQFYTAEITQSNSQWSDFNVTSPNLLDYKLFNFVSGTSSSGVPYQTYHFVSSITSLNLTNVTNVFAKGGSDGTMNDAAFAESVSALVKAYADPNDPVQDLAVNVESIMYDPGYPLQTKYDLMSFISQRKDTFVVVSVFDANGPIMQASEEYATAIALRTRLQMYPESDYFGTPVTRGMIVGRSGKLVNSQWTKKLPLTNEVAIMASKYMGAGNGIWKSGSNFDGAPGSIVKNMYDINITFVPASVRNINWSVGLNWVQNYDRSSLFFPALKTVYDDDTSVLNSFITAMAIAQLNKIAHKAWREFSGVANLTNAQLIDKVNTFISTKVNGIFDNRFVVVPDTFITNADSQRGYSWTSVIKLYAPNMKTVMTTYVQSYRIDSLATKTN